MSYKTSQVKGDDYMKGSKKVSVKREGGNQRQNKTTETQNNTKFSVERYPKKLELDFSKVIRTCGLRKWLDPA